MNDLKDWLRAEWDRVAGTTLIILGLIFLALGWRGVATSGYVADQLAYIASGGLFGLAAIGGGATLLICADLHDEWRKLDRVSAILQRKDSVLPDTDVPAPPTIESHNGRQKRERALSAARATGEEGAIALGSLTSGRVALLLGASVVLAGVPLFLGWRSASGTGRVQTAIEGLGFGVVGLLILAATSLIILIVGRHRVRAYSSDLFGTWLLEDELERRRAVASRGAGTLDAPVEFVFVGPAMTRYHREGCPTLSDSIVERRTQAQARKSLEPCGICRPR